MEGIKDTFRHFWLVFRCSVIGVFVGILPGAGGGVAQWMAYAHAVQSAKDAKDRERFGKGDVRGVLGPGAANNSKEGGELIPTVAFGVPGSGAMAILLSGFLIMGLTPGPDMLTKHLAITFSMVWTLAIANIITVLLCLTILDQLAKVTYVRGGLIIPFVLLLVFVGSYTANNQIADLVVTADFRRDQLLHGAIRLAASAVCLGLCLGQSDRNLFVYFHDPLRLHLAHAPDGNLPDRCHGVRDCLSIYPETALARWEFGRCVTAAYSSVSFYSSSPAMRFIRLPAGALRPRSFRSRSAFRCSLLLTIQLVQIIFGKDRS